MLADNGPLSRLTSLDLREIETASLVGYLILWIMSKKDAKQSCQLVLSAGEYDPCNGFPELAEAIGVS